MERGKKVHEAVNALYAVCPHTIGKWMWNNHVQEVAEIAKGLAEKYGADAEKAYCAALLHDVADSTLERGEKNFAEWSEVQGAKILAAAGFPKDDVREIIEVIIRPHSCHPGTLPTTIEGKILSTSDALWHLKTNFFPMFLYKQRPVTAHSYEEWQDWFDEKIEREYRVKIFFEDERESMKENYEALKRVFGSRTNSSKEE